MKLFIPISVLLFAIVFHVVVGLQQSAQEDEASVDHQFAYQRCVKDQERCVPSYRNRDIQYPRCCSYSHVCRRGDRGYSLYCLPKLQGTPSPTSAPTPTAVPTPTTVPKPTTIPTPTAVPTPTTVPKPTTIPTPTAVPTPTAAPKPTTVPTPTAVPTPTPPTTCGRVRKEISDLTAAEWNDYVEAVKTLHERASTRGGTIYDDFTRSHGIDEAQWHGGQYFLPAHRQMLWEFESELQRIKPGVTIPYYDWSINFERWPFDNVWGRVGGGNGGPIPNQPFQGWRSASPADHAVTRLMVANSLTNGDGVAVSPLESREALDTAIALTSSSFEDFATYVEIVHGLPHIEIGGDMSNGFYSPSDPVFYLHHAFVDKIWRDWQRAGAGSKFDGAHRGVPVSIDQQMRPLRWGRTVREIMGEITSCVSYSEPSRRSARRAQFRSAPQSDSAIAGEKADDANGYRKKVQEVKTSQDTFVKGATFSKLPPSYVNTGLSTKKKIQEITQTDVLNSDIQNPGALLAKSDSAIEQEGKQQASAGGGSNTSTA